MSNFLIAFRLTEKGKKEEREGRKISYCFYFSVIHEFRHAFMLFICDMYYSFLNCLFKHFAHFSTSVLCENCIWELCTYYLPYKLKYCSPFFIFQYSSRCFLSYAVLKLSSPISQYLFSLLGLEVLLIPNSSILTHIFT